MEWSARRARLVSDTPLHHHHTPCTLSLISTSCHLDQWEASIFLARPIRARSSVAKSPRETEKYIFTGRLTRLCEHWNLWYIDDAETLNSIWNIICQHMLFKVRWGKFWMLWIMTIQHVWDCCDGHSLHMAPLMVSQEVALSMLTIVNNALFTLYPSYLTQQADPPAYCHICLPSKNPCQSFSPKL